MTPDHDREAQRHRDALVRTIQNEATETAFWTGRERFCETVINAIARVPRHAFMPDVRSMRAAYANRPQPIGLGQTISQPYIVALMTDLLNLQGHEQVLEIGTGSGYQTAVLAEIVAQVYSIERFEDLATQARTVLSDNGYTNVHLDCADGARGWPQHAPYEAILVTACADGPIPEALIEQLAPRGRMVIPLGPRSGPQMLTLGLKNDIGTFTSRPVLPVAFVPLISPHDSPLEN